MLEEERKYEVDAGFTLPELDGCVPDGGRLLARPAVTLRATYYDTPDLRLARAGVSLRHRRGERGAPALWTAKLPTEAVGVRKEVSRAGGPGKVPAELVALLTAYHRGAPLEQAASMRTVRRVYEVRDRTDRPLAELDDDTVTVLDGRRPKAVFREIEVERKAGNRKLLDRLGAVLCEAGAVEGAFTPKHVRAIGSAAAGAPDLAPPNLLPRKPTAGEVVTAALRKDIGRIIAFDPLVRLREPLPDGDTPVHQMRVGCRRLRSDLRSFGPLLDKAWTDELRGELGWIAGILGAARDAEVLRERLQHTAAADPLAPLDGAAVARIDADLTARHEDALSDVDEALGTDRYLALVDRLLAAARAPKLTGVARRPGRDVLPALVGGPWRKLAKGGGRLEPAQPDDDWHAVRIAGKRARYAAEAVAGVVGGAAPAFAKALADVQTLLGEHQDAAVAADTWLAIANADPDDHALAVTAGRLYERERAAVRAARAAFPAAWQAVSRRRLTDWMPA
jgi:CHAD domain-containing protein